MSNYSFEDNCEDWKNALDQHKFTAAILVDISKAFDCLPMTSYFKN
jgi:hypothetical protein